MQIKKGQGIDIYVFIYRCKRACMLVLFGMLVLFRLNMYVRKKYCLTQYAI